MAFREKNGIPLDEDIQSIREQLPRTSSPIVLDGLYQLEDWTSNKLDWNLQSIYWKDDEDMNLVVRRGLWFLADNMQPLSLNLADAIENHHLKHFKDQVIPECSVYSETEASKKPSKES